MNKILSIACRIVSTLIAIPAILFFTQLLVVAYMLVTGSVSPGDRMYADLIVPTPKMLFLQLSVAAALFAAAFLLSRTADRLAST